MTPDENAFENYNHRPAHPSECRADEIMTSIPGLFLHIITITLDTIAAIGAFVTTTAFLLQGQRWPTFRLAQDRIPGTQGCARSAASL